MSARNPWHIIRSDGTLVLARRLPVRFDVVAETWFEPVHSLRLAHQVRQDLWRALQKRRGFAPVVAIEHHEDGLLLRAGGHLTGRFSKLQVTGLIQSVLDNPANRRRWARYAGPMREGD